MKYENFLFWMFFIRVGLPFVLLGIIIGLVIGELLYVFLG